MVRKGKGGACGGEEKARCLFACALHFQSKKRMLHSTQNMKGQHREKSETRGVSSERFAGRKKVRVMQGCWISRWREGVRRQGGGGVGMGKCLQKLGRARNRFSLSSLTGNLAHQSTPHL